MHARGGRAPDPVALRRWAFVDAVARGLTLGPADAMHPTLAAISHEAWARLSAATAPPALAEIARGLEERALAGRTRGELSTWPAAALLLAARLPPAVAAGVPAGRQTVESARHLGFAILELGVSAWQAIHGPPHKALREGHGAAVLAVARDLQAAAERHRDRALDGPADREHFSEQLLLALPYALGAMQLDRFLLAASPDVDHAVRAHSTAAEEMFVRLQDGLVHQWLDCDDARLREDRDKIIDARQRGDALAVHLLLREAELGLLRPRAARDWLLGAGPFSPRTEASRP
jgi:hypothetical protein